MGRPCGYPTGTLGLSALRRHGPLDAEQASRLTRWAWSPGRTRYAQRRPAAGDNERAPPALLARDYLGESADTAAAAGAVSAVGAASEFQVSRMINHFPSFRRSTVRNSPESTAAPDLSVFL